MRLGLIVLSGLLVGCSVGPGPLAQSCAEVGLTPGTVGYQRCEQAKTDRQAAGTRSAMDTIRSVDTMGWWK